MQFAEAARLVRLTRHLYARFTPRPRFHIDALRPLRPCSGDLNQGSIMMPDILFLLGGLAVFLLAGLAVRAADRL